MTAGLYIAARAPRPGFAKTRLGKAIGHEAANVLYTAFLKDLAARFASAPFPVGWYVTPEDAWASLAPLVHPHVGPVVVQGPGDWGVRQQALFSEAPARGETRTILVASDSPQLTVEVVVEAFALLEQHDLVLGPVDDGGYYLVGMRGPWPVLGGVPMSTRTVLAEIVARAEQLGLSVGLVESTFDVDEAEDLARLAVLAAQREDLPATRMALAQVTGSNAYHGAPPLRGIPTGLQVAGDTSFTPAGETIALTPQPPLPVRERGGDERPVPFSLVQGDEAFAFGDGGEE